MIDRERALEIALGFLKEKQIPYKSVLEDRIHYEEAIKIPVGKYRGKARNIFTVMYHMEGYDADVMYAITIDAETGEILFILTPHSFIEPEDWK